MVIDPIQLLGEIKEFVEKGIDVSPKQIMISPAAHIVLSTHQALDVAYDKGRVNFMLGAMLGTTKRGIGPAYEDKARRRGLRADMMRNRNSLVSRFTAWLRGIIQK